MPRSFILLSSHEHSMGTFSKVPPFLYLHETTAALWGVLLGPKRGCIRAFTENSSRCPWSGIVSRPKEPAAFSAVLLSHLVDEDFDVRTFTVSS